jgi:hypothetical protein
LPQIFWALRDRLKHILKIETVFKDLLQYLLSSKSKLDFNLK